jgi:hypothetical protein
MSTVFSYIVQKRLFKENENVATEALAFIVNSSEDARTGLMNLLMEEVWSNTALALFLDNGFWPRHRGTLHPGAVDQAQRGRHLRGK